MAEFGHPHHIAFEATALGSDHMARGRQCQLLLLPAWVRWNPTTSCVMDSWDRRLTGCVDRHDEREAEHSLHNLKDLLGECNVTGRNEIWTGEVPLSLE